MKKHLKRPGDASETDGMLGCYLQALMDGPSLSPRPMRNSLSADVDVVKCFKGLHHFCVAVYGFASLNSSKYAMEKCSSLIPL